MPTPNVNPATRGVPLNPPPSIITTVIFDLDGTLVDSREAVVDAVAAGMEAVLRRHGFDRLRADRNLIMDAMGLPPSEYYRRILPPELSHLAAEVQSASTDEEVRSLAEGRGRLYPGVADTLRKLKDEGFLLAIVSNAQEPYFVAALHYLDLDPLIDHRECHEQLPPESAGGKEVLVQRALHALSTEPRQAVMVGDRREDIEAGRRLGTRTAGVSWGFARPGELDTADWRIDSLAELPAVLPSPPKTN